MFSVLKPLNPCSTSTPCFVDVYRQTSSVLIATSHDIFNLYQCHRIALWTHAVTLECLNFSGNGVPCSLWYDNVVDCMLVGVGNTSIHMNATFCLCHPLWITCRCFTQCQPKIMEIPSWLRTLYGCYFLVSVYHYHVIQHDSLCTPNRNTKVEPKQNGCFSLIVKHLKAWTLLVITQNNCRHNSLFGETSCW